MDYMSSIIEKITVERNKKIGGAILGEIHQIAVENGFETKIVLNEKNVANALSKQIPKMVKVDNNDWFCCPNCHRTFGLINHLGERNIYCGDCGQKIDWSDHPTEKGGAE